MKISKKQIKIAKYIIEGYSNTEISEMLGITLGTVKFHVSKIINKTGAKNRTNAAYLIGNDKNLNTLISQSKKIH